MERCKKCGQQKVEGKECRSCNTKRKAAWVKKVKEEKGNRGGKTVEQIERENKRAAAIENLKGKGDAEKKLRKIYRHLPDDQIEYIIAIYEKYNSHKRKPTARIKRNVF